MAAAVGVPVVELSCHPKSGSPYSANSPRRFRPWGEDHIVIQPEAFHGGCEEECIASQPHCILGIDVEQVKQAAVQLLNNKRSSESHRNGYSELLS